MINEIEDLKKDKPHLEGPLNLYKRVLSFENRVKILAEGRLKEGSYPPDLTDAVIEEFAQVFDISSEILSSLKEAIRFCQVDFLRLPYNEIPSFALPYHEEEVGEILFILSRPIFTTLKEAVRVEDTLTSNGKCPVCHSTPSISSISENEVKIYYCSFCGFEGRWNRIGCPSCLNRRGEDIEIIMAEEERGLRLELCTRCRNYIKTFQRPLFRGYTPQLIDIISLPLDIIAQSRGFTRLSPNPIGLRKMI